ncbi:hypothetical protein Goklo_020895, partial [Gossypium klotzschianum]|nr:hypothetical protein [Gossypium klotzschianum]
EELSSDFTVRNDYKILIQNAESIGNNGDVKTSKHIFRGYPSVVKIWRKLDFEWPDDIANGSLQEWLNYIVSTAKLPIRRVENECWKPLEAHFLKINFDATFQRNDRRSCTGIVIRNWGGQVVGSITIVNYHIPMSFATEALACLYAMSLGIDFPVDANRVAHILTRKGLRRGGSTYLEGCVSDFVRDAVDNDRHNRHVGEGGRNGGDVVMGCFVLRVFDEFWGASIKIRGSERYDCYLGTKVVVLDSVVLVIVHGKG